MSTKLEIELRLSPRRVLNEAAAAEDAASSQLVTALQHPPLVEVGADFGVDSDDQDEVALGRHAAGEEQPVPQKCKLERAFLDRGMVLESGNSTLHYFSDPI